MNMKRFLSAFLSLVLVLSLFVPCYNLISSIVERKSAQHFCNLVSDMNNKYALTENAYAFNYNQDNPNAAENRLIVKTEEKLGDINAVDSVFGLGYAVLQYDDKGTMLGDYDTLLQQGYSVEKDRILSTNGFAFADDVTKNWGYDSVGAEYAKLIVEEEIDSYNEVVVGVLDSGVDYTNEVLSGRIDDISFNMSGDGTADCMDNFGHGTSVAGIIALSTPENVRIKPYKITDKEGYVTLSRFISAMEYILAEKNKPDIMNISIGGYLFDNSMSIETELVEKLVASGVTVCVAAGNDNLPVKYCTPADCEGAITVGAYDETNHICSFSNYGDGIDIAAPGYNIYDFDLPAQTGSNSVSGTSVASPFASAACAYILMQDSALTPAQVKEKLTSAAIDMGEDERPYFGSGMLNIPNLIENRTEHTPIPTVQSGLYHDAQSVEFKNIPDGTQLVYTLDKSVPSSTNGEIYANPIVIDNEMQLNYALIKNGEYVSSISSQYYTIQHYADESLFQVSSDGIITSFSGNQNNIVVPDVINGIKPTSVSDSAFANSTLTSVVLPDTVTELKALSFNEQVQLKHIDASGVKTIGDSAFFGCGNLRDETMPNLESVGTQSFADCSMLHKVDFENSLKKLAKSVFEGSGITEIHLTNLDIGNGYDNAFSNTPLLNCSIPNITSIGHNMFYMCYYLNQLNAPDVDTIGAYAFSDCYFLSAFDMANVTAAYVSAFSECYIDILYAPKLTEMKTYRSSTGFGYQCHSRVIDFPALTNITANMFRLMYIEELYLKNVQTMSEHAFLYLDNLKVLYMPKVKEFCFPYSGKSPIETLWIPSAESVVSGFHEENAMKLYFAPSLKNISDKSCGAVYVLSDKAETVNINLTTEAYQNKVYPTIVAPSDSAAEKSATELQNNGMGNYINSDTVDFKGVDAENNLIYSSGNTRLDIPLFYISDFWNSDLINKATQNAPYLFVFDFTNDKVINAKDYSKFIKLDGLNDFVPPDDFDDRDPADNDVEFGS